jgi:hypothetical protein
MSEIAVSYQKNMTKNTITEISWLDIGFENLIETPFIEQRARTGDTISNSHERNISFSLINLGQKPISHCIVYVIFYRTF